MSLNQMKEIKFLRFSRYWKIAVQKKKVSKKYTLQEIFHTRITYVDLNFLECASTEEPLTKKLFSMQY